MKFKANHQRIAFVLLLVILSIGTVLRVYDLGNGGYNTDEVFSVHHASLALKEIISNSENEPHPQLYYILLHFWMKTFGDSEIVTRLLSSLFGIISIFLMYRLGRLLFNKETGIIASLIIAISTFHITYSQESRMYSLMAMLTLASMFFFIKMMREKSIKIIVYYQLSSILLLYSHIYGFFIILSQNLYLAIISLKFPKQNPYISLKKWIAVQSLLLLAFIPWIWIFIHQIIGINNGSFVNLNWLPSTHLSGLLYIFFVYAYYDPITLALFSLLSLSVLITWKKYERNVRIQRSGTILFLFLWLLVPILVPFVISMLAFPIYYPKYTISSSLAFYMLISRGISQINNKYLKGLALSAVIFLSSASIIYYLLY
ncbi:MAG: glycosyltransferase family 39 protein [Nanoarchaeota archaeon]